MVLGLGLLLIVVIMAYMQGGGAAPDFSGLQGLVWAGLLMFFLAFVLTILWYEWRWYRTKGLRLLRDVRDEVASGLYDREEIAHRLRQHEKKGIYVHSLTYALLHIGKSSQA